MTQLLDNVAMALGTLRANPLRSLLTLLGIVIGAGTVVAMMSLTEGLREKVTNDFAFLGPGTFQVQKWPAPGTFGHRDWRKYEQRRPITREQGEGLRGLPHVRLVSIEEYPNRPEVVSTREKRTKQNIDVGGVLPDYMEANGVTIAQGRFITDGDVELGRRVAVLGADVADLLFPGRSALGEEVRLRGRPFEVVGVAERRGSVLGMGSKDGWAMVPWPAYELAFGRNPNNNVALVATSPEDVQKAIDEVVATLRRLRGLAPGDENDFDYYTNESATETLDQLISMIGAATFGVCALALLVGGIGIMNIMLVSVTERTREIGVRKALGARRRRILAQFLFEAVTLSALGGLFGVLIGAGLAVGAREVFAVPASVPAWAVLLSLFTACGAGLLFGIYPAARASRLDPVEAMRTE
jgi:putative ABC transport system permease protein